MTDPANKSNDYGERHWSNSGWHLLVAGDTTYNSDFGFRYLIYLSQIPKCGGQADKVLEFGPKDRGFESSYRRPTSSLGSPLLVAASFPKSDMDGYFIIRSK